jgi:hypothetical protein
MDALPPSAIRESIKPIPAGMYRGTVGFVIACVSLTALLLLGRRLAGALVEPLATPTLLWIGLLLAGCGAAVRWRLVRQSEGVEVDSRSRFRLIASTVSTVATLAFAGAVSLPGTSTTGLVCLWFPVVAGELGWLINLLIGKRSARPRSKPVTASALVQPKVSPTPTSSVYTPDLVPRVISQHTQRGVTDDARDACFGWVRTDFQAKQRTDNIHLSFCPPFTRTPALVVTQVEGPELQIRAAQVLPYGARLELRLGKSSDLPVSTVVGFTAVEEPDDGSNDAIME